MPDAKQEPESDEEENDKLKQDGKVCPFPSISTNVADEQLKLCVLYNQGEETVYVVKPTTLFSKIRGAIAKKYGIEEGSFRIDYDGNRCANDINPKMMEMVVGRSYRLDIHVEQLGGGMVN